MQPYTTSMRLCRLEKRETGTGKNNNVCSTLMRKAHRREQRCVKRASALRAHAVTRPITESRTPGQGTNQ